MQDFEGKYHDIVNYSKTDVTHGKMHTKIRLLYYRLPLKVTYPAIKFNFKSYPIRVIDIINNQIKY